MKLTMTDQKILKLLKQNKQGMACYQIAKEANLFPMQIFRRLKKMANHKIIKIIYGKPSFYTLNNPKNFNSGTFLGFCQVECPKCQTLQIVHPEQQTKVCDNEDCLTPSKIRTRFYIYYNKNRIKGFKKI